MKTPIAALTLLALTAATPAWAQSTPYSFAPSTGWYSTPGYDSSPQSFPSYSPPTPATSMPAYGSGGGGYNGLSGATDGNISNLPSYSYTPYYSR